jgi:predicted O-methyltransferase YrrM
MKIDFVAPASDWNSAVVAFQYSRARTSPLGYIFNLLARGNNPTVFNFATMQRLSQLALIARYGARQMVLGAQGKAYPLAQLHDLAWFDSAEKKLPTVSLESLFPAITDLAIRLEHALPKVRGNVTLDELAAIAAVCQYAKPQLIFEFGTFNGRTTLNLAANAPSDAKVFTLDLPTPGATELATEMEDGAYHLGERTGSFFQGSPLQGKIKQLWCDSARFDETSLRGRVDLVFVDGAHSYEYVRSDSAKALAMTRPGGVILWHDYCAWYPGVSKCLHELLHSLPLKHIEGTHLAILCQR